MTMKTTELIWPVLGNEWEHLAVTESAKQWSDAQSDGARNVLAAMNQLVFPNNDSPTRYGMAPAGGYWGASGDTLPLPNGGGAYTDLSQPETNSPEVLYPRDAYRHMCAIESTLAQAVELCPQPTLVWLMNRSRRARGSGQFVYRAGHLNVQMPRDDWRLLCGQCFSTVLRAYVPFTTAVAVLLGSGAVGDEDDDTTFLCSQRLEAMETIFPTLSTTARRSLSLNLRGREETLSADPVRTRNHCIGGDTTLSPTHELRIALVQAASYALLRATPARAYPDLSLQAPLAAARRMNRDPCATVRLNDGRRLCAMDLAEAGLEAIDAVLAEDEHAAVALPDWSAYAQWLRQIITALRGKDLAASGVEWAAKMMAFEGLPNETAHELDVLWHQVEPALFAEGGEHLARECGHGPAYTAEELATTLVTPPAETRAYLRSHIVQHCIADGERVEMCDWDGLNLPGLSKRISLPNAEDCNQTELGQLEGLSLNEILAGPAEKRQRHLAYNDRYRTQHHSRLGVAGVARPSGSRIGASADQPPSYPVEVYGGEEYFWWKPTPSAE